MATLEEIKALKAAELKLKMKEEEERLKKDAHDSHTIRSFFEQEMEREIKKTGFFKKLMYTSPLIIFVVMLGLGFVYIYFKDLITIRDANAQAYAIEAVGKATASAITQVGVALKQNPDYIPLTTAQKWDGKLPNTMVSGQNPPFINTK
jgi:lipid-binding SYLF domain-containing protein